MADFNKVSEGDTNLGEARKKWLDQFHDPRTLDILERDARVFFHQSLSTPCLNVIDSCKGSKFKSLSGMSYLDFHGNNLHQVGFANEIVIEKIKKQLDKCVFSTRRYTNETAVEFAEKLTSLLPEGLNKVLFAPGGASVNGIALKLARLITGKHKVISYWDSFHGASLDTISVGGDAMFRQSMGPLMSGILRVPPPMRHGGVLENEMKTADYIEYIVEKEGDIGALIAEPIRNTDVQIPSKAYWKRVRDICSRNNIILILDEIPTALGRTGKMFAFQNFDIEPDILCIGKGLGGGIVPFAAMIAREEYNIAADVSLGHYTHEKNPVCCAAGHAVINFIEESDLLNQVKLKQEWMCEHLFKLKAKHRIISDVRGIGLLWAIELRVNGEKAFEDAEKIMYSCLQDGLNFKVSQGNVLTLSPALTVSFDELEEAIGILDKAFQY